VSQKIKYKIKKKLTGDPTVKIMSNVAAPWKFTQLPAFQPNFTYPCRLSLVGGAGGAEKVKFRGRGGGGEIGGRRSQRRKRREKA